MECEIRGMDDANPRISDTLPRKGRVNEVCREWVVHEDEALAIQLQQQEVEQHYGGNKERNARVRQDFPKAKEEQEKEIIEAAEKYRQMVRQQEMIDSTYARRIAEKLEREELERRRRAEIRDQQVAKKMQVYEIVKNNHTQYHADRNTPTGIHPIPTFIPDVNRIGLPIVEEAHFDSVARHNASTKVTHSLRNLRLNDGNGSHTPEVEKAESCSSGGSNYSANYVRVNRTPTPATLLPEDLNEILTDADLQEEANRRAQEQKDEELAKMLQKQEEAIVNEKIDRDRLMAIEAQDKELAKLLYEKEKAKLKRAKERARQRALQKKQAQTEVEVVPPIPEKCTLREPPSEPTPSSSQIETISQPSLGQEVEERRPEFRPNLPSRTPVIPNVAMHIDPTYLSQQSSSMPNSLIFQEGDNAAPPYMPIQGQRRNTPSSVEKKQKKSKPKDGCKQQ